MGNGRRWPLTRHVGSISCSKGNIRTHSASAISALTLIAIQYPADLDGEAPSSMCEALRRSPCPTPEGAWVQKSTVRLQGSPTDASVVLPLHPELLFALEAERDSRKAQPTDHVLVNPVTGQPLTRPRLYQRTVALGQRAGVTHVHPHRFRDTFAVDLLLRGASPYDVAKMLGDTIETVEKHYMPFVRELRERVRRILENGAGLEEVAAIAPETQADTKKPN
jgi:Phage integrase family